MAGWVLIIFDVSEGGKAINAEIIDSNLGMDRQREALEIIELFNFRPVIRDERPIVFENWVERVDFLPIDGEPDTSWPQPDSYMDGQCR